MLNINTYIQRDTSDQTVHGVDNKIDKLSLNSDWDCLYSLCTNNFGKGMNLPSLLLWVFTLQLYHDQNVMQVQSF